MALCARCVTPENAPGVTFDRRGICNHCREYDQRYSNWENSQQTRAAQLQHLLAAARAKSSYYDALVPLSGGKDSCYVLYLATKKYGLRVLAFTFDNGFLTDVARSNLSNAIQRTGADHITIRPNRDELMRLYRHFYLHTGLFCPVCMRGICAATFSLMEQFQIPLVLKGTSERTEERLSPEIFQDGRMTFFERTLRQHPFDGPLGFLQHDRSFGSKLRYGLFRLSRGRMRVGTTEIQLPDFEEWNYAEIFDVLRRELGWQRLPDRDEHVDCRMDPVMHFLRRVRVPELTTSTLRYSAEIRSGQRDRTEALQLLESERQCTPPAEIELFMQDVGLSAEEFEMGLQDCFRHCEFQRERALMRCALRLLAWAT